MMKASLRLGRVAGVDVGVHWSVLVIVGLLGWSLGAAVLPDGAPGYPTWQYWVVAAAAAALFAGSILAHELSHAIVAVREGVAVDSIVLWMFGGVAKLRSNAHTARSELRIAIAGPATSLVIGATAIVVAIAVNASGRFDLAVTAVGWLGVINLVLALFNLMPGAPLDGGRVLTAVLWRRSGDEQLARRRSAGLGRILGQVLVGLGIIQFVFLGPTGLWTALVGWLIMSMARMEMVQSEMHDVLHGVRVAEVMTSELTVASSSLTVAEFMNGPWPQRRVSSFPIVDAAGRAVGVVSLRQIGALPPDRWTSTPLTAIAVPIGELVTARPEDMLIDVLEAKQDTDARVLVSSGERLVGIVSPSDIARAVERLSLLRRTAPRPPTPVPPPPARRRGDAIGRPPATGRSPVTDRRTWSPGSRVVEVHRRWRRPQHPSRGGRRQVSCARILGVAPNR